MRSSKYIGYQDFFNLLRQRLQEQPLKLPSHGLNRRMPIELERIGSGFPTRFHRKT
jgi:hypothetical protein